MAEHTQYWLGVVLFLLGCSVLGMGIGSLLGNLWNWYRRRD